MGPFTIFYNANIITMDPSHPRARVLVTRGEYIIAVGGDNLRQQYRAAGVREIDCQGKTLLPGFHDAHCHIISLANSLINLDCSPQNVRSIKDIRGLIAGKVKTSPPHQWIIGEGYDEFRLEEKRHPNRWDLDAVSPHHPVRLNHRSRHAVVLNSRALEAAGLSIETPDPPGGLMERSPETGAPTGLLFEMNRYLKNAPPPDEKRILRAMKLASEKCLSAGITSLQEAGAFNDLTLWRFFQQIKGTAPSEIPSAAGQERVRVRNGGTGVPACGFKIPSPAGRERDRVRVFAPRITMMAGSQALPDFLERGLTTGYGNIDLRLGALKFMLDRTTGRQYPPQEELEETVLAAHRAGFQVAIHAIEAEDIEAAITAIEKALRVAQASLPVRAAQAEGNLQSPARRHRIEHCSVCPDPLLDRIKKAGVVVVTQPTFIYYSGDRYLAKVPPQNQPYLYRLKSLTQKGIPLAAGSDAPVVPNDPITGIYAAVTRRSRNGQQLLPGERLGVAPALALYTSGAAYSAFEESYKGSLAPGKLADIVLLDGDPIAIPVEQIKDIKVVMTVIGGQVVWPSP